MKKTFFAIVMMVVIALTSSMSARTVNGNTNDFEACKAYLAENPNDTIQGQDGRIVFLGSDGRVKRQLVEKRVITQEAPDMSEVAVISRKFRESLALDKGYENPWRDYEILHDTVVEKYDRQRGITVNPGKGINKARNRQGLSARIGVGAALCDGKVTPEFSIGGSYSFHEILKFWLTANVGQMEYGSRFYSTDQRYWSYGYNAAIGVKLFQVNNILKNAHHRVYAKGGFRHMWQQIGESLYEKEDGSNSVIKSMGNDLSWEAGLAYEFDPFGAFNLEVSASYVQNFGGQLNAGSRTYNMFMLNVAMEIEVLRSVIGLK